MKRLLLATLATAQTLATMAQTGLVQTEARVVITGSLIKRLAREGALPVQVLGKDDIAKSGATSAAELLQQLPAMQGFLTAADSVGGPGYGNTTASLRNLGSAYTLVLLNGRRLAPFNTGATVNLEQLPLAAVARVEILADGASALYGADAIAGVVNFITEANSSAGAIEISASQPQKKGGRETRASIGKGWGDVESKGFHLRAVLALDKVQAIATADREFSRTGVVPIEAGGRPLYFWALSPYANPPNVVLLGPEGNTLAFYNPELALSSNCGSDPASIQQDATCRHDVSSVSQVQPEARRKSLYLSGQLRLNPELKAFAEGLFSNVSITSRFSAPHHVQMDEVGSPLFQRHVLPTLSSRGLSLGDVAYAAYVMNLVDAGGRTRAYGGQGRHLVLGLEGSALGFDGSVSLTHSKSLLKDHYAGGYLSRVKLDQLIADKRFDPFAQGSAASMAALKPAVLDGLFSAIASQLDVGSFKASRPLFELRSGSAWLGLGLDLTRQRWVGMPSSIVMGPGPLQPDYADFPVGGANGLLPFDASRKTAGMHAELLLPLAAALQATASARFDSYSAAWNAQNFDSARVLQAPALQGNGASKSTFKLALRWQPTHELLLRASAGTGFRAPELGDITDPLQDRGTISVPRPCPVAAPDPLALGCRSEPTQYKLQTGGNPFSGAAGLKPENSTQWSLGMRFERGEEFSAGAEVWNVDIKDVIAVVPEDTAFGNFAKYRSLFSLTTEGATGRPIFTFNMVPFNGAHARSSGLDFDATGRINTAFGRLSGKVLATYLKRSYIDYGFGKGAESSLGRLGSDGKVAFRTLFKLQATLESGAFANTFSLSRKPGYLDQSYSADQQFVRLRNPDGSLGDFTAVDDYRVPAYLLIDWQCRWAPSKRLTLTTGIRNLLDRDPPRSIKTVGGAAYGFDPRYADGRGRSYVLSATGHF